MRLLHYSRKKVDKVTNTQQNDKPHYKPRGFWVSVEGEDDWKSWCENKQFGLDCFSFTHEVILSPDANILYLQNESDLRDFTQKYPAEIYPGQGLSLGDCGIEWTKVAKEYQGIIIAPYVWSCRMELMWYYGWDCASGCIWDASAVDSITVCTLEDE